ncbi:hypothetical protein TRIUR3_10814 [Triticum urartu]|uniref:Uncharacterized protein n=1 Tax=Triticum urartu TaxID=4572 RepID=M7Z9I3_TRIUA|nr:hypothetical protein TRIUR3_10814 [Triticum urartu]
MDEGLDHGNCGRAMGVTRRVRGPEGGCRDDHAMWQGAAAHGVATLCSARWRGSSALVGALVRRDADAVGRASWTGGLGRTPSASLHQVQPGGGSRQQPADEASLPDGDEVAVLCCRGGGRVEM